MLRSRRSALRAATPYLLLAPGLLWLFVFFALPGVQMFLYSVSKGSVDLGYHVAWSFDAFTKIPTQFSRQFGNSIVYGGLATILTFLISYPLAYFIAFRGGRYKNLLLFIVIAPFFTSFLIRTISWQIILGDNGPVIATLRDVFHVVPENFTFLGEPIAVVSGIVYNFLPFMTLPLYAALEKIDPRLVEAGGDLYGSAWTTFRKVTWPLSMPGVVAGTLLTFIPAVGDFINAQLLGSIKDKMIGNVIDSQFRIVRDYPMASALSFLLMTATLAIVFVYIRRAGTEDLV